MAIRDTLDRVMRVAASTGRCSAHPNGCRSSTALLNPDRSGFGERWYLQPTQDEPGGESSLTLQDTEYTRGSDELRWEIRKR